MQGFVELQLCEDGERGRDFKIWHTVAKHSRYSELRKKLKEAISYIHESVDVFVSPPAGN